MAKESQISVGQIEESIWVIDKTLESLVFDVDGVRVSLINTRFLRPTLAK